VTQFLQYPFMVRGNLTEQRSTVASPAVYRFPGFRFYGVGCGKLPISVWLGAKLTRIQFTCLPDSRSTGSTRNG
jgi:hypothetical protein